MSHRIRDRSDSVQLICISEFLLFFFFQKIFLLSRQSATNMTLGLIDIKHLTHLRRQCMIDHRKLFRQILMYRALLTPNTDAV